MIVVAYCRYSSEAQRDGYSIAAQLDAIKTFCKNNDHELINTYIDEAQTGTNADREQFQKMISDSNSHTFQAVIVHKLDCFARDRYDSATYKRHLRDNGVRVISVTEPLDDSPESVILESMLEGMAEYYSKNLSRETKKGKRQAAREGRYTGGGIPLGLGVDKDKRYYIIEEEATIIRDLFDKIDNGYSLYRTAQYAQDRGYRNKNGNLINVYFIRAMIRTSLYAGTLTYAKKKTGLGEFTVDGVVDPIVDPIMFWRIFKKAQTRNVGPIQQKVDFEYLLTGYAYCAHCGSHLYGHSKKFNRSWKTGEGAYQYDYYRCSGSVKSSVHDAAGASKRCTFKLIKRESLETFVIDSITSKFLSDSNIQHLAELVYERLMARAAVSDVDVKKIERQIQKIEKQQDILLDSYLNEKISKRQFNDKNDEMLGRLKLLSKDLFIARHKKPGVDLETIKKAIAAMDVRPGADAGDDYKRQLLSTFVDRIDVSNDEVIIKYKLDLPSSLFVRSGGAEGVRTILRTNYTRAYVSANA